MEAIEQQERILNEWLLLLTSGQWKEGPVKTQAPYPAMWKYTARATNQALRGDLGFTVLPPIGELWEKERNQPRGKLMENVRKTFTKPYRQLPKGSWERTEALEVLADLDRDYQLMKEFVRNDPMLSLSLRFPYDIVPNLNKGKYDWVEIVVPGRPDDNTLKADLYYEGKLYKRDVLLPLEYNQNDEVDLFYIASFNVPDTMRTKYRLFTSPSQPNPDASLQWQDVRRPAPKFSRTRIRELQQGYVAIDIFEEPFKFAEPFDSDDATQQTLKVDLFFRGTPYKKGVSLPLNYVNGSVDLLRLVAQQIPNLLFPRIKIFKAAQAPSRPINWFKIQEQPLQRYTEAEIDALQNEGYVAIEVLGELDLVCRVCSQKALFANRRLMEPFCSEKCHTLFLETK